MSDEMLILGVSIDIRDVRSENKDIDSESDDKTSESAEATRSWNRCRWVVWWCCVSSWSITVRMECVGMGLNNLLA